MSNKEKQFVYVISLTTYFDTIEDASNPTDVNFYSRQVIGVVKTKREAIDYICRASKYGFTWCEGTSYAQKETNALNHGGGKYELLGYKEVELTTPGYAWAASEADLLGPTECTREEDPTKAFLFERFGKVQLHMSEAARMFDMTPEDFIWQYIMDGEIKSSGARNNAYTTVEWIFNYIDRQNTTMWKLIMKKLDRFVNKFIAEYASSRKTLVTPNAWAYRDDTFTSTEIGDILGVTSIQVNRWRTDGWIKAIDEPRTGSRQAFKYSAAEVVNFCNSINGRRYRNAWLHFNQHILEAEGLELVP